MTTEHDAAPPSAGAPDGARRPPTRKAWWPGAAVAVGSLAVAGAGLLSSTDLHGIPAPHATPASATSTGAGLPFGLADEIAPGETALPAPAAEAQAAPRFAAAFKGSPEGRLIAIYRTIGEGRTDVALDAAESLARDMPGFRLAQLVYADLLAARSGHAPGLASGTVPPQALAALGPAAAASVPGELGELREEALQRLHALQERPPANAVPAEFILLPKSVHHAIAVDTSRSRLYLFENGEHGMRLVSDHYATVGKQGVDKTFEGDQRTPLGVYFVADRVGGGALNQRFGAGALELNYPNAIDRLHGRTGSGIYVHGVPQDTYSRPPKDSDGCVVIANDELLALMNTIPVHDTPVIITRSIHWIGDDDARLRHAEILDAVSRWQGVRASADAPALDAFYAPGADRAARALPPPLPAPAGRRAPAPAGQAVSFGELSVLSATDDRETIVVTFHERIPRARGETLRQYWQRDRDQWRIVAENSVR
jgi:hypothetical protein